MKSVLWIALGGFVTLAMVSSAADARCTRASASGVGLGEAMAKEMAKMNLDAGLAAKKQKARGKVSYKCSGPFECKATVRACS